MSQSMVKIDNLKKDYGSTQALRGVSFEIPRGQVVGLLGPNGAGKSTTMRILAGYLNATAGQALVAGIDVSADPVAARRNLGYLPENNPLYEDMMVSEFLRFVAEVREIPTEQRTQKIKSAVERCGLGSVLGKDIGQLSKGYRQRVGLAQAIVHDPGLLILDEPTSGLDPNQIIEIRSVIKELGKEKTVLLSTHILPEVQSTCSRVLIIANGQLKADDSPEHLTSGDGGRVTLVVASKYANQVDEAKVRAMLSAVAGVTSVEAGENEGSGTAGFVLRYSGADVRRSLFEAAVSNELILLELKQQRVTLEESFRKLTTTEARA